MEQLLKKLTAELSSATDEAFCLATVVLKPKDPGSAQVEHTRYLAISSRLLDQLRCDLAERGVVVQ